jgi:hypothetical protein
MRGIGVALIMAGLALPLPAAMSYASELLAVDACLDQGGSYDYAKGRCDDQISHPYVTYEVRHPLLAHTFLPAIAGAVILVLTGSVVTGRSRRDA